PRPAVAASRQSVARPARDKRTRTTALRSAATFCCSEQRHSCRWRITTRSPWLQQVFPAVAALRQRLARPPQEQPRTGRGLAPHGYFLPHGTTTFLSLAPHEPQPPVTTSLPRPVATPRQSVVRPP